MKKLILLLFIPLLSFGQGDFRKMNWGDSVEDLKKTYPEVRLELKQKSVFDPRYSEEEFDVDWYTHQGKIIGIDTEITYLFQDNKLIAGIYFLDPQKTGRYLISERFIDFINISRELKDKEKIFWQMGKNTEDMIISLYVLGFYYGDDGFRYDGFVSSIDKAIIGNTRILHFFGEHSGMMNLKREKSVLQHTLVYSSNEWAELMK